MYASDKLLAFVEGSPAAVAVHDRTAWVDLYARDGVVNDPVGSRPHRGHDAIARFYDTFIAPNTIEFHVEHDMVSGMSVVRDLSLTITMSAGGVVTVPMHLRYDLVDDGGSLEIARLAAHWELASMIGQLLRGGFAGVRSSIALTPQMIGNQGVSGLVGFMSGLRSVGAKGKSVAADRLRSDHDGATFEKFIAAGRTVSATVRWGTERGVVFVNFAPGSLTVESVTLFR
ncbi:nuclear transport factor 2 family protein [Rhodococcoides kyotonense]|uniref:SnoaL-like domain-containing protein n=1 Tax=Rhodococcoides kyotonense TaxID=398843 RepID=A0A177Y8U2_9NOCA|nr:nuclear transport factor 2 family protein [Rhodococcus kyotonensis]OAK51558.1 hypothetical protein A3K89_11570 [Rhodococcus kyotonensis]